MSETVTRTDLCLAVCEGIDEAGLRSIIKLGGLRQLVDASVDNADIADFAAKAEAALHKLAHGKTELSRLRAVMLQMLLDMEQVR